MAKDIGYLNAYHAQADRLAITISKELRRREALLEDYNRRALKAERALKLATQSYFESAIAVIDEELKSGFALTHGDPKDYFQALAKELDRPFICAIHDQDRYYNQARMLLTVPGVNRLKNVVAGLNLAARPREGKPLGEFDCPVVSCHNDRVWKFYFLGKAGLKILDNFIETCRTDPVLRITLKI